MVFKSLNEIFYGHKQDPTGAVVISLLLVTKARALKECGVEALLPIYDSSHGCRLHRCR